MLARIGPDDGAITAVLAEAYGLAGVTATFLPWGYDSRAAVFRVANNHKHYFLKIREGAAAAAGIRAPALLKATGVEAVVAPLPTRAGGLAAEAGGWHYILYPFVDGRSAMEVGLSERQWREYSRLVRAVHEATPEPPPLWLPREDFVPIWGAGVRALAGRVGADTWPGAGGEAARTTAAYWRERAEEIDRLVGRAFELGARLQADPPPFVLCHADIHTANVLVDEGGRLHIVDWDGAILAPKERDLMFIVGDSINGVPIGEERIEIFLAEYGGVGADPLALAYYRYEWVVQEIGEFGQMALERADVGEEARADAARQFRRLFAPGDVVERAYETEAGLRG